MRGSHANLLSGRRAGLLLPGLLVLLLASATEALPPEPPAPPEAPPPDAVSLPTDRQAQRKLQTAADYLKSQSWPEVAHLLQAVLDSEEDAFLQRSRKGRDGRSVPSPVGARQEAERMIAGLPARGREFYRLHSERLARERLKEARARRDPRLLAEVVRRWFHTAAGAEAADLLGTWHLDRGRPRTAAVCFRRLLTHADADRLPPLTLFKAALAFRLAGDRTGADAAWERLSARLGREGLKLGSRVVPRDELRRLLEEQTDRPTAASDWPLFRGSADRAGRAAGDAFFLEPDWHTATFEQPESKRWLDYALRNQRAEAQPVLPAFFPIAVGGRVIYRSHGAIHAVQARTGKPLWKTACPLSLDRLMADPGRKVQFNTWVWSYDHLWHLLYENSVLGTLSADRCHVYAVEDVPVPVHPDILQQIESGKPRPLGPLRHTVHHNRLRALDLDTGRVVWEVGGPDPKAAGGLGESFFLGPPLPLDGQLFALVDQRNEIRLVCLDPSTGRPDWQQTLARARDQATIDLRRRLCAASLAYADGVLICPTGTGAVVAVDLFSRRLLWAHVYRRPGMQEEGEPGPADLVTAWKPSAPVIHNGKVVFTAPDAEAITCFDVRDGSEVWQALRSPEDLYLAGISGNHVLLVGRTICRALRLADGKEAWQVATGEPSGQGAFAGPLYYLPLARGAVCTLDVDHGKVLTVMEAQGKEVLGNLLFHDGEAISQPVRGIAAYPQVKARLARVNERLARAPNDAAALIERGGLLLDRGDVTAGVADLRAALAQHPPPALAERARRRLFTALMQLLQRDFTAGEKHLDELRRLCAAAPPAERARRREHLARLIAIGREKQGRTAEALQAYRNLLAEPGGDMVPVREEPVVQARRDVWARGRIMALLAAASPAQRQMILARATAEWKELSGRDDLPALERFVACFGSLPVGRVAQLRLAERLIGEPGRALEAELLLLELRRQHDDPIMAARATEALARLLTRHGLLEDAVDCYRDLARDWPRTVVREGKTGADLWRDLAADKRFLAVLDEPKLERFRGRWKVTDSVSGMTRPPNRLGFEADDGAVPFFRRHRLVLDVARHRFLLLDRATGAERWHTSAPLVRFQGLLAGFAQSDQPVSCRTVGHLALVSVGTEVFAFDFLERRLLWRKTLHDQPAILDPLYGDSSLVSFAPGPGDGIRRLVLLGPVGFRHVALFTPRGLTVVDPVTGQPLWSRPDATADHTAFGDADHLFLVDPTGQSSRAVRVTDGVTVPTANFAGVFKDTYRRLGRRLLASDSSHGNGEVLRLYDPLAGRDLWRKTFPAGSVVLRSEAPRFAGAIDPDGKVTLLDAETGKEVCRASVDPKHLKGVAAVRLLADPWNFYLAFEAPPDGGGGTVDAPHSVLVGGPRSVPINGMLYAFDRATGKLRWSEEVPCQQIVLEQFGELPLLLLAAWFMRVERDVAQVIAVSAFDKRTGKLVMRRKEWPNQAMYFHEVRVDPRRGMIELIGNPARVRFQAVSR